MKNVVENLREHGLSYDTIGDACGETYTNICNYEAGTGSLPDFAVNKLKRLAVVMGDVNSDGRKEGFIFENHVVRISGETDSLLWMHLHELWTNGVISDEELAGILKNVKLPFTVGDLADEVSGAKDVDLENIDGLSHAEPRDFLSFRKHVINLVNA